MGVWFNLLVVEGVLKTFGLLTGVASTGAGMAVLLPDIVRPRTALARD